MTIKRFNLLLTVLLLSACASNPPASTPDGVAPELALTLPTQCKERPEDYQVIKRADHPCLFIDGHEICVVSFRAGKSTKDRRLTLQPGDLSRFANFTEIKKRETFTSGKESLQRDSCDLTFDVETKGKIQRCYYNRQLKDIEIVCP